MSTIFFLFQCTCVTWLPENAITQLCYFTDDTIWSVKLISFGETDETYNLWSQDDLTGVSMIAENFRTKELW